MPPLEESGSTLRKKMKVHEASFRTAHTNFVGDNKDTSAWAKLLNKERGEDERDGMNLNNAKQKPQR